MEGPLEVVISSEICICETFMDPMEKSHKASFGQTLEASASATVSLEGDYQNKECNIHHDPNGNSTMIHHDNTSLSDRSQSLHTVIGDEVESTDSTLRKLSLTSTRFERVDSLDPSKVDGQWLLRRYETIFDYEYKYRTDTLPYPSGKPNFVNVYHMIILVSLPARGKTYIARKLCRYLNWCSIPSKVINLGEYRRQLAGTDRLHDFFRADNQEAQKLRHQCLVNALDDAKKWLSKNNRVVILDATNTTRERRQHVYEYCADNHLKIWHSSLPGAIETAGYFEEDRGEKWGALDYLDCGECHGMKFSELAQKFPGIFTNSKGPLDFTWRYPGGESYKDMVSRLEPVIMTTMRCLMAYFLDHNPDEVTHLEIPLHTLFKLTPVAYGCRVEKMTLNDEGSLT